MKKFAQIFALLLVIFVGTGCDDKNQDNQPIKLEAPEITLGEITAASAEFSWKQVKNAVGYEYKVISGEQILAEENVSSNETSATVEGLTAETEYKISIRTVGNDKYETSPWVEKSFITAKEQEPEPVYVEIKDEVLRKYLIDNGADADSDGNISFEEAAAFKNIEMGIEYEEDATDENTVKNLSGLEFFTSLEVLNLKFHEVSDASPIEKLASLTSLNLGENPIASLDLTALGNLADLRLYGTDIEELNLAAAPGIKTLYLQRTALTSIDLSVLPELEQAFLNQAELTALNASGLQKLTRLDAVENNLTEVNISDCGELMELHLNNNSLESAALSGLPKLMRLNLYSNKLTTLDLSELPLLMWLFVFDNNLEVLNISGNVGLRELYASRNPIKEMDFSVHENIEVIEMESMPDLEFINLKNGYYSEWAEYYIANENPSLKKVLVDEGQEFEHVSNLFKDRPEVTVTTGEEVDNTPKVYIVGSYSDNTAVLWVDGKQQDLTDGGIVAVANDVYVTENKDIYIVGWDTPDNTGNTRAIIWKNGEMSYLSDGRKNVQAKSVFVYGEDVYVAGNEVGVANKVILWKNGVQTILPSSYDYAEVGSMTISETGDIYVAGYDNGPVIWKNGVKMSETLGDSATQLLGICLNGSDIYCSGYRSDSNDMYRAMVWKGTQATELTDGTTDCYGNAVWVSESGDVYVAGNQSTSPKKALFWKNGASEALTSDSYKAFDVLGFESDIYVVGQISTGSFPFGTQKAVVWKNGEAQVLYDYKSEARAIFIR